MSQFLKRSIFYISPFLVFRVAGKSMLPTLQEKKNVLVFRYFNPQKGDVIICKDPRNGRILIKRITNLDGKRLFIEGDNKNESTDSRTFGWVDRHTLIGKVIYPKV